MSAHIAGKSGSVLAVVSMSSTATPSTRRPTIAPGRRHPVIGVRQPGAGLQWRRGDLETVGGFAAVAAQPVDLGGQRGQPVGLVAAQVGDAGQAGYRARGCQRREHRHRGGELADVTQVDVETGVGLRALHL